MRLLPIKDQIYSILNDIPSTITLVAASKTRTPEEVKEAFEAGLTNMGENYIKEAIEKIEKLSNLEIRWHFIGHLQKNKVKKAVKYFDVIQTVDSVELSALIDKEAKKLNKIMDIMIEINIAKEPQKSGVFPEETMNIVSEIEKFENIKLIGLMTMGPVVQSPEEIRPFFKLAKNLFEQLKPSVPTMQYLSMGMSDSYKVAIEEGSNMIRIGSKIFGPRKYS